ncbi:alpha/beta fold hydrolase [Natronosporangium hydrolyticum]|uniref:Alpha/beta fold hydrolase n=1 Tax=Natronosporangium hydrolyticum TaxID=2811111 RepID=A0A895YJM4_9ACTN|nr:alpha/beta fold hydrolase [Natronosporangium hydrolyticum]QSB16205.1 alpha/beta fold hydrolase [Natronosporangium hydrolyticum]
MTVAYEQRWIARGSEWLGLQWYPPPADPQAPIVLILPAMGVPAGFYRPFATMLQTAGLAVVVADHRGTGASTPRASRRSSYGYAELVDDVAQVRATVATEQPNRPLVLLGHSLGGQAAVLHLAAAHTAGAADEVAGLALVGSGLPYWRLYPWWRLGLLGFTQGIHATSTLLRVWPGWGFGGRQARGVMRDWAHTARVGRFPELAGIDHASGLPKLQLPVLAVSLERDTYVPAFAMDHLLKQLPAAPVERVHLTGPADHFSWARKPEPVATEVARFVAQLP